VESDDGEIGVIVSTLLEGMGICTVASGADADAGGAGSAGGSDSGSMGIGEGTWAGIGIVNSGACEGVEVWAGDGTGIIGGSSDGAVRV
jgi:hypothetical protein